MKTFKDFKEEVKSLTCDKECECWWCLDFNKIAEEYKHLEDKQT